MNTQAPRPVEHVPEKAKQAFYKAMKDREVDLGLYELLFFEDELHYIITTSYKHKHAGLRGSDPQFPDYEVSISKDDFSVTRVSIAR